MGSGKGAKEALVKKFGEQFGWKIEKDEFVNYSTGSGNLSADDADVDVYPMPAKRLLLEYEDFGTSMESVYFWFLNFLRQDLGYPQVDKIYDSFSASENSALWGSMAQRAAIQQDRASQFLRGISELVRTLFQLVRELRVIDERLEPYKDWRKHKSADVTLKGVFASLVEQGANNPDSIYSLARNLNMTVLPDLFFNTHVYDLHKIDDEIDKGSMKEFNKVVKTVLKRKLYQYINWKEKTEKELYSRRKFQLQYLRQHWATIQLYMSWIKPYLKTVRRLGAGNKFADSADLIGAFDTSRLDIEILAKKKTKNGYYQVILANFVYRTKPILQYRHEIQQQSVGHLGNVSVNLRSYGWHEDEIAKYKELRAEEDMDLLGLVDDKVNSAMEALGDEFKAYLKEADDPQGKAEEEEKTKTEEKSKKTAQQIYNEQNKFAKFGLLEPFLLMGDGFVDLFKSIFIPTASMKKKSDEENKGLYDSSLSKAASKGASAEVWVLYEIYKKSHGMLSW